MLTHSPDEAHAHAKLAGLAMHDVVIPANSNVLHGLRLSDDDLIIEFPSFEEHPRKVAIRQSLHTIMAMCKAKPPWERVGR